MEYKKNNSAKWKAIRHLLHEPPEKFDHKHVDPEGRSKEDVPRAKDGTILFEDSSNYEPMNLDDPPPEGYYDGIDGEARMAEQEIPDEVFNGAEMEDEDAVADLTQAEVEEVSGILNSDLVPNSKPAAVSTGEEDEAGASEEELKSEVNEKLTEEITDRILAQVLQEELSEADLKQVFTR